jgi:hypothetical protein
MGRSKMIQDIYINFMPPGMLEFGIINGDENINSTGYGDIGLGDLQVDRDVSTGNYLAFVAYNFHHTYFDIIRRLESLNLPQRYNIPDSGLNELSLEEVLTWIYARYIIERKKERN